MAEEIKPEIKPEILAEIRKKKRRLARLLKLLAFLSVLVVIASLFAWVSPEGFEKLANIAGMFKPVDSINSILGLEDLAISTLIAGIMGIFIIYLLMWLGKKLESLPMTVIALIFWLFRKKPGYLNKVNIGPTKPFSTKL